MATDRSGLTRRQFLSSTGAALGAVAAGLALPAALRAQSRAASEPASRPRRPNILLVITDDQRWDAMSCVQKEQGDKGRFPWLKTPNMDRLAAGGVLMRNAFCVTSLCSPSRACMLTGKYGNVNGVLGNNKALPPNTVTWATLLRAAGYRTGYFGKWHMDSQPDRPGFDLVATYVGQGEYFDCPLLVNGKRQTAKSWLDDVITDYALQMIEAKDDRPFAAMIGYKATHGPWQPPKRNEGLYSDVVPRDVPNLQTPAIYKTGGALAGAKADKHLSPLPADDVRNYFRALQGADDNLGRILDALDRTKQADDTLIIFVGDNGYYLGEHGLRDKRSAYDESLRLPMIVRYGGLLKPGTCDAMALNVDFAPTIMEAAGVKPAAGMHGASLLPLLTGRKQSLRSAFLYLYQMEPAFPGTPSMVAVRTAGAKLVTYPGHDNWTEAFDLAKDPYETRNLVADASAADLRKELTAELQRQKEAVGFKGF